MKLIGFKLESFLSIHNGNSKVFETAVPPDTCVLVGRNGCGKSILLESLAHAANRGISPLLQGVRNSMSHFGNSFVKSQLIARFDAFDFAVIFETGENRQTIETQINAKNNPAGSVLYIPPSRDINRVSRSVHKRDFSIGQRLSIFDQNQGHYFEETLVSISDREIQAAHHKLGEVPESKILKRIRDAYKVLLPEINLIGAFGDEFLAEKNGSKFSISSLSHGEKQALILFSFVAKEADLTNSILIIDEPDIGLSRELKSRLIPSLRAINPHMQIVVSTHSAEIIHAVEPEKVLTLTE